MSGKMVRPHMGAEVGDKFVANVKWLMNEHGICRDDAVNLMIHQSRNVEQVSNMWVRDLKKNNKSNRKTYEAYYECIQELRKENRKLYMVIAILSAACVTLAVL